MSQVVLWVLASHKNTLSHWPLRISQQFLQGATKTYNKYAADQYVKHFLEHQEFKARKNVYRGYDFVY